MAKKKATLNVDNIHSGLRFVYYGVPVEILKNRTLRKDRFGLQIYSWWARRIDTGDEGWFTLGPEANIVVKLLD